jgi:IS4 transposase
VAKYLIYPAGSVLVMNRAYVDYAWLLNLDSYRVYFVTRLKSNSDFHTIKPHPGLKPNDLILDDQIIQLSGYYSQKSLPGKLRVVTVYDPKNDQTLYLLTNHLSWTADTIAQPYRSRWTVEVFFKLLKQLFRVKSFVGTSENAVKIQMWCSVIAILVHSYLKSRAKFKWKLSNLINYLRINLIVKMELWHWPNAPFFKPPNSPPCATLFNL